MKRAALFALALLSTTSIVSAGEISKTFTITVTNPTADIVLSKQTSDGTPGSAVGVVSVDPPGGDVSDVVFTKTEPANANKFELETAAGVTTLKVGSAPLPTGAPQVTLYATKPTPPPPPVPTSHTVVIGMQEDPWGEDAKYKVAVDGVEAANGSVASPRGSMNYQEATFTVDDGTHPIAITFLNDGWGGSPATDRNLIVSYVKYDDSTFFSSPATLGTTGQTLTVTVPPPPAPPPPPASSIMRSYDFYSKFGTNGNLNSGGTVSANTTMLNYLGMNVVRTGILNDACGGNVNYWLGPSAAGGFAAAGIRVLLGFEISGNAAGCPIRDIPGMLTAVKNFAHTYPGSVVAITCCNEADAASAFGYNNGSTTKTGVAGANAFIADMSAAIKADPDPALNSIPVAMWPLTFAWNYASVGDQTTHCDWANVHDYYSPDNSNGMGVYQGTVPVAMNGFLTDIRKVCNKTPFITTETGYGSTPYAHSDQGRGNEYAQARLIMMDMFDHAVRPDNEYVFQFNIDWCTGDGDGWGFFCGSNNPKPSAQGFRAMTTILKDTGTNAKTFTSSQFEYSVAGMPAQGRNFAVAKSDGTYDVLLWQETPIWNRAAAAPIALPPSTVTVTLPRSMSGKVFNPIVNGTTPVQTVTNQNTVTVTLGDAPLIIEVR